MGDLRELFGCDSTDTLNFFFSLLKDEVQGTLPVDQVLYTASVLGHYAQTSCAAFSGFPAPRSLTSTFDIYVLGRTLDSCEDAQILEMGGAEILFLAGFFRDQFRWRHNLHFFDYLGQCFYGRAGRFKSKEKERHFMAVMADNFQTWARICCRASRTTAESRFLLPPLSS